MHDRRRLRDSIRDLLLASPAGEAVEGRVFAGRGMALRVGEIPSIFVETRRSVGNPDDFARNRTRRTYEITVGIVGQGPASDLAEDELAVMDALDEIAVHVEAVMDADGGPGDLPGVLQWGFMDDVFDPQEPGFDGELATLNIRYGAVTAHAAGRPVTS